MPLFPNPAYAGTLAAPSVVPADYARRTPSAARRVTIVRLAVLSAASLVSSGPTGAASPSVGGIFFCDQFSEALVWGVITAATGTPAGVQLGLQVCDLYANTYITHPAGLTAASSATSGMLGVLSVTNLGAAVRGVCVASTPYTGGSVALFGAFKT